MSGPDGPLGKNTMDKAKENLPPDMPKQGDQSSSDVHSADQFLAARSDKPLKAFEALDDEFSVSLAYLLQSAPEGIRSGLGVYSANRSTARQKQLWQAALKKYGSVAAARRWVAPPGHSRHEMGIAADLSWKGQSLREAPDEVVTWIHENAAKHGLHFPLGNENWHIEKVGSRSKKKATQTASS